MFFQVFPYELFRQSILLGCRLFFLPPYSLDLNPIEQAFSAIKAFLRRNWKDDGLSVMDRACHNITTDIAWGFFCASGYVI
ncbi:hypothetical protein M413DRAFT_61843 [Hebeloma cylindrosporum]|uniref:Tc1-like transposase DDE domain-containing protein n=1 Tax=Hebeloma cylindrosporum TaxID=76867 RepID=A0A0C3CWI5_HEBCY|nr:hypothetical protein M413DRAFT_61843 [Hebeloma cylindrosporum h7]